MSKRLIFVQECIGLLGTGLDATGVEHRTWYLWGGKDPETGLDCSGLVTHCLFAAGGPDWRKTHWSGRMWRELPPTDKPRPGDLAFYGPSDKDITHVMVVLGPGAAPGTFAPLDT
jgi:cell wall-associated NlpC family hydrolase